MVNANRPDPDSVLLEQLRADRVELHSIAVGRRVWQRRMWRFRRFAGTALAAWAAAQIAAGPSPWMIDLWHRLKAATGAFLR